VLPQNLAGSLPVLTPTQAIGSPTVSTRQAAQTLLLAIQCVIADAQRTLSLFPRMSTGQKDLSMYLMEKNGLIRPSGTSTDGIELDQVERKERVVGEMVGLMARGVAK
jgi:CLIP-associating protein 1/2